jgi:predicted membrane protein
MTDNAGRKLQGEFTRVQCKARSWAPLVPIIIVAAILFAMIDNRSEASERRARGGESTFNDIAVFSRVERKYNSSTFQRGEVQAFMGGINLDLRDAIIEGDEAQIEVSAIMGGIKIRVPKNWNVVSLVAPTLGGVKDSTRSRDDNKRLVIEGTVFMGGVDITN